uniref:NADP-dependent oxidoreductase domain-containing protein n=1 Tax=Zea mays TaxID=4577 RepID=A0A804RMT5_MAIZE
MEAEEYGEMMESVDEVTFALDGLRPAAQKRTRRASLLALLGICASAERRRVLRSQGLVQQIIDAILVLDIDDPPCAIAAGALLFVLASDPVSKVLCKLRRLEQGGPCELEVLGKKGMVQLNGRGLARVGVCARDGGLHGNHWTKIKPAVNQIETHPYFQRDSLVKFCQKHGICVTAHTPLGGSTANAEWFGRVSCLDDPVIKLVLRWGLQRDTVVIPKTSKVERLQENFDVFGFDISGEDMERMKAVDRKYRTNQPAKLWASTYMLSF